MVAKLHSKSASDSPESERTRAKVRSPLPGPLLGGPGHVTQLLWASFAPSGGWG
jgi:hypothetical protein